MKRLLVCLLTFLFSSSAGASNFNLEYRHVPNELIVTYKADSFVNPVYEAEVVTSFKSSNSHLIRFNSNLYNEDLYTKAKRISQNPDVLSVEANVYYYLNAMPDDPDMDKQYGLHNTGQTRGKKGADIDAPEAWEINTGSKDVLVGVIDTGIDYSHPDLAPNMWTNPNESGLDEEGNDKRYNGIDDDDNGYIDDYRGWDFVNNDNDPKDDHNHGSHCAGVIGASGDNGVGITGVNWKVSLVGLKIFDSAGGSTTAAILEGVEYATLIGVDISSNSWGGGAYSQGMYNAIKDARDAGILFVAAAGNSGRDADKYVNYPSGYELDNIISVAATDHKDKLAGYSNYGKTTVDVAAPGSDVYSTVTNGRYQKMSGTSMATPHVAGLAALIKSTFPEIDYLGIKSRILKGVDPLPQLKSKLVTGGRINALKSLED